MAPRTILRVAAAGRLLGATALGLVAAAILPAQRDDQPQHAPPEAWLPGEKLPYFGSENPWNRRFFISEKPPRIGQPQLLLLLDGRVEEAVALCEQRLAADRTELESLYVLALARGQQGRPDDANRLLETALALGLPPERLLADRSPLMTRLQETVVWRHVARESPGLLHGPMLGAMTPTGVRVWIRTLKESEVEVRTSTRGDFEHPDARAVARTRAADDYTGIVTIGGLQPATRYRYQVRIDGRPAPQGEGWEFRTFPRENTPEAVRIAFGGCAKYFPAHERNWDTIRLRQADAFLILGDNVYLTLPGAVGPLHNYTYHQRQSRPEFRRLVAGVPTFAIWDDHDAGMDDIFLGPYPDKPAWKVEYLELFRRNWNNPSYGAPPEWPGVWHSVRVGPVECFMLDGRYYRENFLKPKPSMLGPVQKAWLRRALAASTAPFKLLVSPVAWADDAKIEKTPSGVTVYAKDTWSGFREERAEIFDFLAEHKIGGVILVSSDRHRHDVRINHRPRGYPLLEIETAWLTNETGTEGSGKPIFEYLDGPGFGFFTFEPGAAEPRVVAEIITIRGEPVFRREVKLSELRDR
jgi:alkaline phosphatase D